MSDETPGTSSLEGAIPWAEIIKIGALGVGAIIDYFTANAEQRAAYRAQADVDAAKVYDLIDNHLLDGNAMIDGEATAKFGAAPKLQG